MCEETVYWDLNYSLQFDSFGTEHIKAKVSELAKTLHNNLFTHSNFVFLDHNSVRQLLKAREPNSSEPLIIYNNLLRWAIFQLDRTLLEECDGAQGADIPVTERSKLLSKIREEKVKDYKESVKADLSDGEEIADASWAVEEAKEEVDERATDLQWAKGYDSFILLGTFFMLAGALIGGAPESEGSYYSSTTGASTSTPYPPPASTGSSAAASTAAATDTAAKNDEAKPAEGGEEKKEG